MNQENFSSKDEFEPKSNSSSIIIMVIVTLLVIVGIIIYLWQKPAQETNSTATPSSSMTVNPNTTSNMSGQIYSDENFTYTCPDDWTLGKNQNYNGEVDLSECSMIYSGQYSFDDGVDVNFGFVPQEVADSVDTDGVSYADTILNQVKNEDNAETYSNGDFTGWISMANGAHTLALVARYPVDGGYYEVTATAMGDTKTDQEYEQIVNDIISTFQTK